MFLSLLKTVLLTSAIGLSSVDNVSSSNQIEDHNVINNRLDNVKRAKVLSEYLIFDYANYSTTAHNYVDYTGVNGSLGTVTYNCVIYDYDGNKYDKAFLQYQPGYYISIQLYLNYVSGTSYSNSFQINCGQFQEHLLRIETLNYVSDSIDDSHIIGGIDFNQMFMDYFTGYNSFTFSDTINRFAPLCMNDSAAFVSVDTDVRVRLELGNGTTTYPGSSIQVYCLFDGYFECQGNFYNRIYVSYYWLNGSYVRLSKNSTVNTLVDSYNEIGFRHLYFMNTTTNIISIIYQENYTPYVNSDGDVLYNVDLGTASWLSVGYKTINIFYYDDSSSSLDTRLDNYVNIPTNQRLNMFNENVYSWGYDSANVYVPFGNVFTLINMSLSGLSSFLGIQILPGVTLGILFLIPFAFTILLFVVKMFKR